MLLIQAVLIVFFLYAIFKVVERFRERALAFWWMFFWAAFWVIAGVVALLPNSASYFARLVGIGRGADLVVYVALVAIFFSLFRLLVMMEKMKREITLLTRKEALEKAMKDNRV